MSVTVESVGDVERSRVARMWLRVPVLLRAVITGIAIGLTGAIPWSLLVSANMRYWSGVPWAVLLMAVYLWLWWRSATGGGWPTWTAVTRRVNARVNVVAGELWRPALLAGALGLIDVLLLQGIIARLATLPRQTAIDISQYSRLMVVPSVLMGAVVAGIVEETSFRGYMQRPIERRHGSVVAILVTGVAFGAMHFTHPEVTLVLLPYYVAVAAVYGTLAYLTDSVLPGMALHAGGNVLSAFGLFVQGRSEWQPSAAPPPLIWDTGIDAAFLVNMAGLVVVTAAAIWIYRVVALTAGANRARA